GFVKRGFVIARCTACRVEYVTEPRPHRVDYDADYFSAQAPDGYASYLEDRGLIQENFARRLQWLKLLRSGGRLLDVGAAYGLFVSVANDAGFDATGVEPAHACAEFAARELGATVVPGRIEDVELPLGSFDIVTMFDVIEHFENPCAAVLRAHELLRPDGVLVIETGDLEAACARVCGRHWYFYDPPQHLTFFGRQSLSRMLDGAGFGPPLAIGHLGRRVSMRNFAFQLGRALGSGALGRFSRCVAGSRLGELSFPVPDRGNALVLACPRRAAGAVAAA
ncbi:MAG: class I SAM-dependent methyltransferase, partial [bacterium]